MNRIFLVLVAFAIFSFSSCKKDKDEAKIEDLSKTFISEGAVDGIIHNSNPRVTQDYYSGGQGKEICMGWDSNGNVMRGFLSFDITSILPASGKELIIDEANLKVFEANTNLNPFTADGTRTVKCYLVDYKTLDISDYDAQTMYDCGVLASTGNNVLQEHKLDVTDALSYLIKAYPTATTKFQFRLQFTSDNNNVTLASPLHQAMWNIFSGNETGFSDYRPILEISYYYKNK